MSRVTTFIYGIVIVCVALDAMLTNLIPIQFLPFALIIMGGIVLFTPITSKLEYNSQSSVTSGTVRFVRRGIFGVFMVFMGIVSVMDLSKYFNVDFSLVTITSLSGQCILIIIGVIYFLATFTTTRRTNIGTY